MPAFTSRPYHDSADVGRMKALLVAGLALSPVSGYMHTGWLE